MPAAQVLLTELFVHAGIQVNGPNPWDPHVHNARFFARALAQGNLGLGESYMDGWWDCARLDEFFQRLFAARLDHRAFNSLRLRLMLFPAWVFNHQRGRRAFEVGRRHYDAGNDLFQAMLDRRLTYTCGYWESAANLDDAQEAKLDLVCRKLGLQEGQRVLDVGCGWGSFCKFAAQRYGVSAVGITVSKAQVELGRQLCAGWPVELRFADYHQINGTFDHIVSLGMFEHVGYKNYRTYFKTLARHLKDEGLFLLHTIGSNHSVRATDPWIERYIFPNSQLPSIAQIGRAIEGEFVMEDWHNFGPDYDRTLMAWQANIEAAWEYLDYDTRFQRMWRYFLLSCAASFRARRNQLWQLVLSKGGVPGGHRAPR